VTAAHTDVLDSLRQVLLRHRDLLIPLHEFIDGEVAHFQRQGFTAAEARTLTVIEFAMAMAANISNTSLSAPAPGDDGTGP
jgi:hypothetical protein